MTTMDIPDAIDAALRAGPDMPMARLRAERPVLREMNQANYLAVLYPDDPGSFRPALRAALATRMARLWRCDGLAEDYEAALHQQNPITDDLSAADPGWRPAESGRLAAVLRHVDLVTRTPKQAAAADIAALYAVGLDDGDIVTLSGLIAFVNYQILIVSGLTGLKGL